MKIGTTDRSMDLPSKVDYGSSADRSPASDEIMSMEEAVRCAIVRALRGTNGNKAATARLLGIGRTTLYRKLEEYQILEGQP